MSKIVIDLTKEKFTELIAEQKELNKYANLLAEHNMFESVSDFFYGMPTAISYLLESNALNNCLEDDFYEYMQDDNVSAEYIANLYYPYFCFTDGIDRMTQEAKDVEQQLVEDILTKWPKTPMQEITDSFVAAHAEVKQKNKEFQESLN